MKFKNLLSSINNRNYVSPQYELSKKLIDLKLTNNLTQKEMAEIMNLSFDEYLKMERCSLEISIEKYREVIERFNNNFN